MIDPSHDDEFDAEAIDREALARRIGLRDEPQLPGMADETESVVRRALDVVESALALKRSQRELLNAEIKELVDEQTVIKRAVHVFDRWRETDESDEPEADR